MGGPLKKNNNKKQKQKQKKKQKQRDAELSKCSNQLRIKSRRSTARSLTYLVAAITVTINSNFYC